MSAVALMPSRSAVSARVPTVQYTVFSSGQVALYTMAAGESFVKAPLQRASSTSFSRPADRKMAMDEPWAASFSSASFSGTGVRPAMRVRMRVWEMPGSVNSAFKVAAAPNTLETPGVTS